MGHNFFYSSFLNKLVCPNQAKSEKVFIAESTTSSKTPKKKMKVLNLMAKQLLNKSLLKMRKAFCLYFELEINQTYFLVLVISA